MAKKTKNRQNTPYFEIFCAIFSAKKSARRVCTPRAQMKLPQTTPRKPQEPRRTFFSAENGLKMAKNDHKPLKYALFSDISRYFQRKKVRGGCARPVPTCNYLNPPPESLRNRGALFFRTKTASEWPKTTKNRQNTP